MRHPRSIRRVAIVVCALVAASAAGLGAHTMLSSRELPSANAGELDRADAVSSPSTTASTSSSTSTTTTSSTSTTTTTPIPVVIPAPARTFATGDARLDALLPRLPALLFEGDANVHYGYNPLDECCHAGGYNPAPNDAWIGPSAFSNPSKLIYVVVHELAHSVHVKTSRSAALTAAVAGAPVVRAGGWDDSEKVADCVAWVLYPAETAASHITYWSCPEPYRSQVRAALGYRHRGAETAHSTHMGSWSSSKTPK